MHGKTIEMIEMARQFKWRTPPDWVPTERDRTLRGKARIKARKRNGETGVRDEEQ